jgi:hypothetical protein
MEFFDPFSDHEISQGELEIYPFPLEVTQKTWVAVTIEASYFVMR